MSLNNFFLYSYFLELHKIFVADFIRVLHKNNKIERKMSSLKMSNLIYDVLLFQQLTIVWNDAALWYEFKLN